MHLNKEPYRLYSARFSPQSRTRLYWTNLPWGPFKDTNVNLKNSARFSLQIRTVLYWTNLPWGPVNVNLKDCLHGRGSRIVGY